MKWKIEDGSSKVEGFGVLRCGQVDGVQVDGVAKPGAPHEARRHNAAATHTPPSHMMAAARGR